MIGRQGVSRVLIDEITGDPQSAKRLVVVYGLGGVGKSTLIASIRDQLPAGSAFSYFDENFQGLRDGRQFLSEMSRQANASAGVPADSFNETLTRLEDILERLIGSNSDAVSRLGRLLSLGVKTAADTATGGPVSALATEILEPFAIRANAAWQRVRTAHRIAHADGERELLDDPLGLLTRAFFDDIENWATRHRGSFILAFDTFEVVGVDIEAFLLDRIVPIIANSPSDLRLMLSGRFPLSHYDGRWIDKYGRTVLQVQILPFTVGEIELYLEELVRPFTTGSVPTAEQLYAATAGLPFLLERWRVSGMSAQEISSTSRSTFDRLTCWLNAEERQWLCTASLPLAFDLRLLRHMLGPEAEAAFAFLSRDESVCERITSDHFSVHGPLRAAGLDALADSGRLADLGAVLLTHLAEALRRETELLLSNSPANEGRIKWLIAEWVNVAGIAETQALQESIIDDLCLVAAISPNLLADSPPLEPREKSHQRQPNKAASIVDVLHSIGETCSLPGLRFVETYFADAGSAVGFQMLAGVTDRRRGNLQLALKKADAAVAIRAVPRTLLERGTVKMLLGRFKRAESDLDEALKINPSDAVCWATRGEIQRQQGKYLDAAFSFSMSLKNDSAPDYVHAEYADALAHSGDLEAARDEAELACILNPGDSWNLSIRAHVAQLSGDLDGAREFFAQAWKLAEEDYSRACIAALKGEKDLALSLLGSALREGIRTSQWARYDPDFRSLQKDPEFIRLTRSR